LNAEDMPSPKDDVKDLVLDDDSKAWRPSEFADDESITIKTETEPKQEDEDTQTSVTNVETKDEVSLNDMDKFEPIESDEDEQFTSETLDIKTELDDSQDRSMESEVKDDDDELSQDAKPLKNERDESKPSTSEVKPEADQETKPLDEKPTKQEGDLNVLPKDEIEDIQQKLHSFHSKNLMILQTRNRKRASRATTPTSMDEIGSSSSTPSNTKESSCSSEYSSKSRKFSSEEKEFKREPPTIKSQIDDDNASFNQFSAISAMQSQPPSNQSTPNTNPYSSYLNNAHRNDGSQHIFPPTNVPPPGFANVHPQLAANASNSLYHYLENPNRPGFNASAYNANADTSNNPMRPHLYSMHTNVPPPTLLNSSNYLTKSYTTLSEPSTPTVPPSPAPPPSVTTTPLNPKVLTRTQSADPRLNPQKDQPPATPKRKLSINEYRKRKQLTSNPEKSKPEEPEKNENSNDSIKAPAADEKPKSETKETVFSPAPTLLELQQESLSRRLKSYKSLHGLSSQIETSKSNDASLENEISTSISEVLNASSSSSLTSVSSPKSDIQDFDIEGNDTELATENISNEGDQTPVNDSKPSSPKQADDQEEEEEGEITEPNENEFENITEPENEFDVEPANVDEDINDLSETSLPDANF